MKHLKYLTLSIIIVVLGGCNKKDNDAGPATNVDISGTYSGDLEIISSGTPLGTVASVMYITNKSGNVYNLTNEAGGQAFAELTVSGSKFKGKEANGSGLTSLSGSLSGDDITITALNDDTTYVFTGTRPKSNGGGPSSITIDGVTYKLIPESNGCEQYTSGSSIYGSYGKDGMSEDYSISFLFHGEIKAGNYDVVQLSGSDSETTAQISDINTGETFEASGGTTTVTGTGGKFTVTLDEIVFDLKNDTIVKPRVVKGTLTCQ